MLLLGEWGYKEGFNDGRMDLWAGEMEDVGAFVIGQTSLERTTAV